MQVRYYYTLKKDWSELPPIGKKVRNARENKALSLRDLALKVGISKSQLSAMELGRYTMNPKVTQFLGVNNAEI